MRPHQKFWSIRGDGDLHEIHLFLNVWIYRRVTSQKWAPLMHEYERERGVRIGHRRFGMTETVKHFFDGKDPQTVKGAF